MSAETGRLVDLMLQGQCRPYLHLPVCRVALETLIAALIWLPEADWQAIVQGVNAGRLRSVGGCLPDASDSGSIPLDDHPGTGGDDE